MADKIKSEEIRKHVLKYLEKNCRYDGRKTSQFRNATVELGASRNAEGSARVKIGDTEVIVGVKLSVEKPYSDTPNKGNLMVNAELLPMSSKDYEPGPPRIKAIVTSRVIDRGIRESHTIDTEKLCITPGEAVWGVIVDICAINDDGNILDAAALGAMAALKAAVFPEYDATTNTVNYKKRTTKKLPIDKEPLPITVFKMGDHLFVDPLPDEERHADGQIVIGTLSDGTVSAMQKGGEATFSVDEVLEAVALAKQHAAELRKLL